MANQIKTLMSTLNQSVDNGINYFEAEGSTSKVRINLWEPREILAHLIYWHELTANALDSNISKHGPVKIHASIDEMNARAVGRAANRSIKSMLIDIKNLNNRINESSERILDTNAIIVVYSNASEKTVEQMLELVPNHWNTHISELRI